MKSAKQIMREVAERLHPGIGCMDGSCVFGHPGGVSTNGGCECLKETNSIMLRRRILQLRDVAHVLAAVKGGPK